VQEMLQSLPATPNFWSDNPGLEFAHQYQQQQQQAMQAQNYLQSMQVNSSIGAWSWQTCKVRVCAVNHIV